MSRLDDVLISRAAWGARKPKSRDTNFTKSEGIIVHYSTRNAAGLVKHWPDCYESWRAHQRYHMDTRGWSDLAYNFAVCPHGFAFEGRGWGAQNAANTPLNSSTLSICFDGDANDTPIGPAVMTYKNLIERAVLDEGWDAQVRGHSEVSTSGTACPGAAIKAAMLPELKAYVATLGQSPPPPPPPEPPAPPFEAVVVLGSPTTDIPQMQRWATAENGTIRFTQLAVTAYRESIHIGVDPAVTYAIMRHETNAGNFTGVLDASFHNWGGLKVSQGGSDTDANAHHRFPNDTVGVRAVAQHAGRYAGLDVPQEEIVDPRWYAVTPGVAPSLPDDDWKWAYDTHDDRVVGHVKTLRQA